MSSIHQHVSSSLDHRHAHLRRNFARALIYLLLAVLTVVCVIPFYSMIINATRTSPEINNGISLIPGTALLENFTKLSANNDVLRALLNSTFIAFTATFLSMYVSALTAFGLANYKFRGRKAVFMIILAVVMLPQTLGYIGFFQFVANFKMLDNYLPLIIPAAASPFAVFFLKGYTESVLSYELIQAARIDGAKELYIFHRIAVPIIMPGIATMGIFTFIGNWNNYLMPLLLITSTENYTLPMVIAGLTTSTYKTDFGLVYLGVAMSVVPIIIMFTLFSRYVISGITVGSLKE